MSEFNSNMSEVRQAVEWSFEIMKKNWAMVGYNMQQKIMLQNVGKQMTNKLHHVVISFSVVLTLLNSLKSILFTFFELHFTFFELHFELVLLELEALLLKGDFTRLSLKNGHAFATQNITVSRVITLKRRTTSTQHCLVPHKSCRRLLFCCLGSRGCSLCLALVAGFIEELDKLIQKDDLACLVLFNAGEVL
ncbi:hypothetical protein H310_14365 [Aphanomyces invadans]|uniref:Uncharacterized protein n=1 Tax=Aphanomyces invadans TaxID=157072 RepID=A0A024TBI8_9STRA|nr:hypothetical protein H310_14365 [Aphanomyces invadans]ETV90951.1 hypothetical protein H310_14365 [Aphanomyces invadans]|eukprot:XP_008880433.1 hypothetical protein H310_14365 [Aphanomyces invadans]